MALLTLEGDSASNLLPCAVGLDRLLNDSLDKIIEIVLQKLQTFRLKERQHHINEHEVAEVNLGLLGYIEQGDQFGVTLEFMLMH